MLKNFAPGKTVKVRATRADGTTTEFDATVRIDTPQEVQYYQHGGILQYVLRQLMSVKQRQSYKQSREGQEQFLLPCCFLASAPERAYELKWPRRATRLKRNSPTRRTHEICRSLLCDLRSFSPVLAWAQWSSDPSKNLALSDIPGADQVQPKVLPLPNNSWYVSWFNNNPNDPPPNGYDVYYQMLDPNGYEQFPHDGIQVAKLTLSSTEDYGLAIDASGNALLAFQDDRKDPSNPQITAAKMSPSGQPLWGASGISLTFDSGFHASPKITATSDGNIVVGWTTDSAVILQKLDPNGHPLWVGRTAFEYGVTIQESGFNYSLADLHAADNGSVIVSWVRNKGFGSNNYLYANKVSASGQLMWGAGHVKVFDGGSLQFGEFPYFTPDGSGGAVFSWYSSSPSSAGLCAAHPDRWRPRPSGTTARWGPPTSST